MTHRAALHIPAADLACIRAGMWSLASEPEWNLAMRTLDRLEGKAVAPMSPEQAQAFMSVIRAPIGLKAAESSISVLRARVEGLERLI